MQGVNKVNYHPDEAPITADNEIILFFTDIVSLDLERFCKPERKASHTV